MEINHKNPVDNYRLLTIENATLESFISADSNPVGGTDVNHIYNYAINGEDTDQSGWEEVLVDTLTSGFWNGTDIMIIARKEIIEGVRTSGN